MVIMSAAAANAIIIISSGKVGAEQQQGDNGYENFQVRQDSQGEKVGDGRITSTGEGLLGH